MLKGETLAYTLRNIPEKACDCIVFTYTAKTVIMLVYLKGHLTTIKGILEKFENNSNIPCRILKEHDIKNYKIYVVLASKSFSKRPLFYNGLLCKIKIDNTIQAVRKIKCGDHLADFL